MNLWSQKILGTDEIVNPEDLLNEMRIPGFTPEDNLRLVFAPNEEMVGYIEVWTYSKASRPSVALGTCTSRL